MHVERDETFATKLGSFHCKTKGDLDGTAAYGWNAGEAELRVDLPPANLRRACQEPGFPVSVKALPAAVMLLVLRSDRLIGKTSALDHTVLLPQQ
jgi:hypothetical protein